MLFWTLSNIWPICYLKDCKNKSFYNIFPTRDRTRLCKNGKFYIFIELCCASYINMSGSAYIGYNNQPGFTFLVQMQKCEEIWATFTILSDPFHAKACNLNSQDVISRPTWHLMLGYVISFCYCCIVYFC